MPVTMIVGGQFGSEGKGKVAHIWCSNERATTAIRVGGPNSGHTVCSGGTTHRLRMLPTAATLPETDVVLPAGSYIDIDVLFREMARLEFPRARLFIDPNAVVVTDAMKAAEADDNALAEIGSTQSGTGAAVIARARRDGLTLRAEHEPELKPFLTDTLEFLRSRLDRDERIVVEGTQGYGLSLLHSRHYPHVTSRDTSAAGLLAETGLSPRDVDQVVLVLRAFPIRVAGPSGPLHNEITWGELTRRCGARDLICEQTTVTGRTRRVGLFDAELANRAIRANTPTHIVLNHVDYFDATAMSRRELTPKAETMLRDIQSTLAAPLSHIGLGPDHLAPLEE